MGQTDVHTDGRTNGRTDMIFLRVSLAYIYIYIDIYLFIEQSVNCNLYSLVTNDANDIYIVRYQAFQITIYALFNELNNKIDRSPQIQNNADIMK